jgi:outer membrane receptor protein involved in Fe transport
MKKNCFLVFCSILIFAPASLAQGFGSMVGRVTDPTGAVVASVKVTATEHGTRLSRSATSDAQGLYVIPSLRPSSYDLTAEANGFSTFKQSGVTLLADQTLTVNISLKLGATTEVITVTSTELQVDTTTSTLKQVVEIQRVLELPLNGRNVADLTLGVPGAVSSPSGGADQGNQKTFPGGVTLSVNGSRQNQMSYQLDGGNFVDEYTNINQPFPFPDALQEFSVQTSNYSAAYGQNAGAVVNVVTKSGTNSLHGDVFEFVRNAVFNARKWDSDFTKKDNGRDQLKRSQFGGVIGGPIRKDKTFFFAGYQGTRLRNTGDPRTVTVLTPAQRAGVTDPAVRGLLAYIPVGDANAQVTFTRPDRQNYDEVLGRLDHSFSQNDRLTLRYDRNRFHRDPVFDPSNAFTYSDGTNALINNNYLIHETHVFKTNLINDFRFSFARETSDRGPAANVPNVTDFGVRNIYQPATLGKAILSISVQSLTNFTIGDNARALFTRNNFTWSDDVSWVRGKHDLRFGGVIERSRVDIKNPGFFGYGNFRFADVPTFQAGTLNQFQQGAGEFKNNRNTFLGLYLQDDFHATRRLTLNLGLRWEPMRPWDEIKGRVEVFQLANAVPGGPKSPNYVNAPPGLFFQGDPGVPKGGIQSNWINFSPRLGFAYDVFGDGKTSLRGGAGIFYDTRLTGIANNRVVDLTPFSPQVGPLTSGLGPFSDPYCQDPGRITCQPITNPFPVTFPVSSTVAFPPITQIISYDASKKYQTPAIYQWNLSLEHQFAGGVLARTAYVGSHSSHLKESVQLNPALTSATLAFNDQRRRLNTPFSGCNPNGNSTAGCPYGLVWMNAQDINSSYNSLQASLEKRISHGLTLLGSYTYSKSIDDLPVGGNVSEIASDQPSALPWDNPLRHQFDRGPSDFDRTHRFVASYVWQLPKLSGKSHLVRSALGEWSWSGLLTTQSGAPLTILSGLTDKNDPSGTGLGRARALFTGGDPYGASGCGTKVHCVDYINQNAFVQPPAGTFGNVGKGWLRWKGAVTWDMGLSKNFSFTERWRLQFRAEFFNVFNHVNLRDTSTDTTTMSKNSSTFGQLISANEPRIGQLALKLIF